PPTPTLFPYPTLFRSCTVERRKLHQALDRQRDLVADAMLMQREQDAHGDEGIAVVVGGVVGRERGLDAGNYNCDPFVAMRVLFRSEEHTSELQSLPNL